MANRGRDRKQKKKTMKKINGHRMKEWMIENKSAKSIRIKQKRMGEGRRRGRGNTTTAESFSVITCAAREWLYSQNIKKSAQQSASTENDLCFILNKVIQPHWWYVSLASLQFSNCVFIRTHTLAPSHSLAPRLVHSLVTFIEPVSGWANISCCRASSEIDQKRIFGQSNNRNRDIVKKKIINSLTHII